MSSSAGALVRRHWLDTLFGNAAELIIALFALREGLHEVVKASYFLPATP